jgi:hypothetical protein
MNDPPLNLEDRPDGATLRLQRRYAHPPERVWRAITDPDELAHWFPQSEPLHVLERDEPRLLRGTWYGDELRFDLRADGDGCVLSFSHTFAEREKAARDAAGWDSCFVRFAALLDGAPIGDAESLRSWPETHERYAERFGVDAELGRRTFAEVQGDKL